MLTIDYIVATFPDSEGVEAHLVRLYAMTINGRSEVRIGFRGRSVPGAFFGQNLTTGRWMVQGTGGMAERVAQLIPQNLDGVMSVARLDIALTTTTPDADADVQSVKWKKGYKALLYKSLSDRGATLYIGSPRSRLRMRVYNKTAESCLDLIEGQEVIRYEIQMRDNYADRAWKAYRTGSLAKHFLSLAFRLLENEHYERLSHAINDERSELEPLLIDSGSGDWAGRRLAWLESTVLPAVNRLLCEYPELTEQVHEMFARLPKRVV